MSERKPQSRKPVRRPKKRVDPAAPVPVDDEALETVAGGCQSGCSNMNSCIDFVSQAQDPVTWTMPTLG